MFLGLDPTLLSPGGGCVDSIVSFSSSYTSIFFSVQIGKGRDFAMCNEGSLTWDGGQVLIPLLRIAVRVGKRVASRYASSKTCHLICHYCLTCNGMLVEAP